MKTKLVLLSVALLGVTLTGCAGVEDFSKSMAELSDKAKQSSQDRNKRMAEKNAGYCYTKGVTEIWNNCDRDITISVSGSGLCSAGRFKIPAKSSISMTSGCGTQTVINSAVFE